MGCDGGTIPRRDELVKQKQKPEQKDKEADLIAKWQHCALSNNKLSTPIVACQIGRLYNKDAVIEYLLNKEAAPNSQVAKHIRSLKDVITLNLTEKPNYVEKHADNGGEFVDTSDSRFICPVVGLDMNGKYKFCYLLTCGCVMSERALKEVKTEACHKCNKEFSNDDVIVINGSEEEIRNLRIKMEGRRSAAKLERKKGKKRKEETEMNGAPDQATSSKVNKNDSVNFIDKSGTSSKSTSLSSTLTDKIKSGYSIAKDPKATETYKSLFTSHESAKKQQKAHWITFNPLYN